MKTIKDQMKLAKRELKARRADTKAKADALRRVERDEWRSFKSECHALRGNSHRG